jgi:hypothetical protein
MLTSARTLATESTRLKAEMQKVPRDAAVAWRRGAGLWYPAAVARLE